MKKYIILFLLLISVANADSYLGLEYYKDKNRFTKDKFTSYNTRYAFMFGMKSDDFRFDFGFGIGKKSHTYSYKTLLLNAYYDMFKFDNFDIFGGVILGLDKGRRFHEKKEEPDNDTGFIYGGQIGITYKLHKHINLDIAYLYQVVENIYVNSVTESYYEEHIDNNSVKIGVRYVF